MKATFIEAQSMRRRQEREEPSAIASQRANASGGVSDGCSMSALPRAITSSAATNSLSRFNAPCPA